MKVSWPRSNTAQIAKMTKQWPEFVVTAHDDDVVAWKGPVRGAQKRYVIGVLWAPNSGLVPLVTLLAPKLEPRPDGSYEEIPHLIFKKSDPANSALCLFYAKGRDWNRTMMIADTIIPWACRWLFYYEMWLYDGVWRGGGIDHEVATGAQSTSIHQ